MESRPLAPALARLAALLAGLLAGPLAPAAAWATPFPPCTPGACTLREAAARAGIAIGAALEAGQATLADPAGALVAAELSSVTPENAGKWQTLSPAPGVYDFAGLDAIVAYAEAHALRVRGHTLVWGRSNGPPAWLEAALAATPDPAAYLRALVREHAGTVVSRYAGRIESWDVVNEPLALFTGEPDPASPYQRVLGTGFIGEAFHAARAADPTARLFLNEIFTEFRDAKFDGLVALLRDLLADGVPIDGVGLQGHFGFGAPDRADLTAKLGALAALGLDVEITELDLPMLLFESAADPLAAQAAAYADVFAACLAVARCTGITTWGVGDGDSWLDRAEIFSFFAPNRPLLFDASLAPKPAYFAVREVLLAVPEPGPGVLLGLGAAALAGRPGTRPGRSARTDPATRALAPPTPPA